MLVNAIQYWSKNEMTMNFVNCRYYVFCLCRPNEKNNRCEFNYTLFYCLLNSDQAQTRLRTSVCSTFRRALMFLNFFGFEPVIIRKVFLNVKSVAFAWISKDYIQIYFCVLLFHKAKQKLDRTANCASVAPHSNSTISQKHKKFYTLMKLEPCIVNELFLYFIDSEP